MKKQGSRRRWLWITGLSLLLALGVGAAVAWVLLRGQPAFWKEHQQMLKTLTPQEWQRQAAAVSQRLDQELDVAGFEARLAEHRNGTGLFEFRTAGGNTGPDAAGADDLVEYRKLRMTPGDLNAWMAANFDQWMVERGSHKPAAVQTPVFGLDAGRLRAVIEYRSDYLQQLFVTAVDIKFQQDGKARLVLHDIRAGNLPVPAGALGTALRNGAPGSEDAQKAAAWLDKLDDVEFTPVFRVSPKAKAQLVAYEVIEGAVLLTVRLEPRGRAIEPTHGSVAAVNTTN